MSTAERFRQVKLTDPNRRGLLGHGSILSLTSVATRTSPVFRGKYVLSTFLNTPPPPPPPNVPTLEESNKGAATAAEDGAASSWNCTGRTRPAPRAIASSTRRALRWRTSIRSDSGAMPAADGAPIDAAGVLADGAKVDGPAALRDAILSRPECLSRRSPSGC